MVDLRVPVAVLALVSSVVGQRDADWTCRLEGGRDSEIRSGDRMARGVAEHVSWLGGGVVDLSDDRARLTFGPASWLGVDDATSFTLELELRTRDGGFATPLMCREGPRVHYSLVMGRDPGRVSFEAWGWARERAGSARRMDDGEWHRIEACYDATARFLALVVDGRLESLVPVAQAFDGSPAPSLRLGNNLDPNVHQPFDGALRGLAMRPGVPDAVRAAIDERERARVFERGRAAEMVRAWNDRHRPYRDPSWTAAQHDARATSVRALVQDAIGLWPPPYGGERLAGRASPLSGAADARPTAFPELRPDLPLDVIEGGSLDRDGYRLTRVYWRTFARWFAGGWLYEPGGPVPEGGRAAVLCPHGHWADGARHPVVQARCITLARHGYVVLAVDSLHVEDDRVALSSLSAMTWANLRGLELLRARDDVDAARIGCTGASGGGQQTYYLTALDSGLAAAVPAVMVCHLGEIMPHDGVHCRCNHTPHLARVVDVPEMSAAFAPRPQLFLSVTGDWTRRFPQEGFPAIAALYEALGASDRVASLQWDKGHDYDRPMRNAMYAFFDRHLRGVSEPDAEIEPEGIAVESLAALRALERDDVPRDLGCIAEEFRARLAVDPPDDDVDPARVRGRLRALFGGLDAHAPEVRRVRAPEDDAAPEAWTVAADEDVLLPLLRVRGGGDAGVAIVVSESGKAETLSQRADVVSALRARFAEVWLADVRYVGELDVGRGFRDLHGRFVGLDEGQLAVRDLSRLVSAVPAITGGDEPVHLVGLGWTGAPALIVAAIDPGIRSVLVPQVGPGWREAERRPRLSRVLLHGDLPDAVIASFAERIVLGGTSEDPAWPVAERILGPRLSRSRGPLRDAALVDAVGRL